MQDEGDYEGDHPQWAQLWLSARHVCCSQFNCTHSVLLQWFVLILNCTLYYFKCSSFLLLRPNAYQEKDNWHATEIPKNLFLQVFFFSQETSERYFSFVTNHLYTWFGGLSAEIHRSSIEVLLIIITIIIITIVILCGGGAAGKEGWVEQCGCDCDAFQSLILKQPVDSAEAESLV